MPSTPSSSSMMFNPSSLQVSSTQNFTSTSSAPHNVGLVSIPSPLNSIYGSAITTVDSLNNNNILNNLNNSNNSSNLSKISPQSASHSVLAAAAALQSLNQSHVQRTHQQLPHPHHSIARPPSNPSLIPSLHGNNSLGNPGINVASMPKLNITPTSGSDHLSYGHMLSSNPQLLDQDFASRFQQKIATPGGINKNLPGWQDQINHPGTLNLGGSRWPYSSNPSHNKQASFSPYSNASLGVPVHSLSNSNNMIGHDGDMLVDNNVGASLRQRNEQPADPNHFELPRKNDKLSKNTSISTRPGQPWPDNLTRGGSSSAPEEVRTPHRLSDEVALNSERLGMFAFNLLSTFIPGTDRMKKIIPLDSIDDLRQTILNGEFYSRYEDLATGILTNHVIIPEFSIIDYIRREKFSPRELEKIEVVHKRLSLMDFMSLMELASQRSYPPIVKTSDMRQAQPFNSANNSPSSLAAGLHQPNQTSKMNNNKNTTPAGMDKCLRSSQSPGDIFSRSQSNNGFAPRQINSHSSNQSLSIHNPPISVGHIFTPHSSINQQSSLGQRGPPTPSNAPRSSNYQAPPGHKQLRPPSNASSTYDGPSMFVGPSGQPLQPPAAHQSSSAKSAILPNGQNLSQNLISTAGSGPISAHMSSKTPQTPNRLHAHEIFAHSRLVSNAPSSISTNEDSTHRNLQTHQAFPPRSDVDPITGLPIQTLAGLKQQESLIREAGNPRRFGPPTVSGVENHLLGPPTQQINEPSRILSQPNSRLSSRSPNNPKIQVNPSSAQPNLSNNSIFRPPSTPNYSSPMTSMATQPLVSLDYQKSLAKGDLMRQSETWSNAAPAMGNPTSIGPSIDPMRQFSNLPITHQNQPVAYKPLNYANSTSQPSIHHSPLGPSLRLDSSSLQPPLNTAANPSDALRLDIADINEYDSKNNNLVAHQRVSPRQAGQRSIITGSASSGPKKNKKAKLSPNLPVLNSDNQISNLSSSRLSSVDPAKKPPENAEMPSLMSGAENSSCPSLGTSGFDLQENRILNPAEADKTKSTGITKTEPFAGNSTERGASVQSGAVNCSLFDSESTLNPPHGELSANKGSNAFAATETSNIAASTENVHTHNSVPAVIETTVADPKDSSGNTESEALLKSDTVVNVGAAQNHCTSVKQNTSPTETSKYQKLYTKKAWLKNYDQEDQARTSLIMAKKEEIKSEPSTKENDINEDSKNNSDSMKTRSSKKPPLENKKKLKNGAIKKVSRTSARPSRTGTKSSTNKTDTRFLQTVSCFELVPKIFRCMECRKVRPSNLKNDKTKTSKQAKTDWDDFCRFYEFRKLRRNKSSQIEVAGFNDLDDAKDSDKALWLPSSTQKPENFSLEFASYILRNVGDEFCRIVEREREIRNSYQTEDKKIIWKRTVTGLRELCDVCSTTLFNYHYVCDKCGFVACIDCHRARQTHLENHVVSDTQKIPPIKKEKETPDESVSNKSDVAADQVEAEQTDNGELQVSSKKSKKDSFGWLFCTKNDEHDCKELIMTQIIASDCMDEVWTMLHEFRDKFDLGQCYCLKDRDSPLPMEIDSNNNDDHEEDSSDDFLIISYAEHEKEIELFRKHWTRGKPVIVRGVHESMKIDMWLPSFFSKEFGDYRSDLVDCRNGDIHRHSMKKYWDGFEPTNNNNQKRKQKDESNPAPQFSFANNEECSNGPNYYSGSALWRLKDWPPGQDFNEILPSHYEDFMNNLPLKEYTTRTGKLNLACRLPKEMLKPDLGPKMYSAYGTSKFPERGTTNLHLDISDAINVMVYVSGALSFIDGSEEITEIYHKTVDECSISDNMKEQIKQKKLIPGALWHIFKPSDAQKMREFLNKVSNERNIPIEKRTDPIHDQTWYLDQTLLDRLFDEYGVKSYPILQCMGDAILIPAGAPHQVKNVFNCIKVANDFVSPENVRFCLQLTDEFRVLPETHINQEDKLQIKNILYHSVKESLQYLKMVDSGKISEKLDNPEIEKDSVDV